MDENSKPSASLHIHEEQFAKLRHELRTPINQILGYTELVQEISAEEGYAEITDDLTRIGNATRALLTQLENCMAELLQSARQEDQATPSDTATMEPVSSVLNDDSSLTAVLNEDSSLTRDVLSAIADRVQEGGHILVVDDTEANRDMLSRRLRRHQYEVSVAEDGFRALEMVAELEFDAILLDVMMPGMSGLEVLHKIRQTFDMTRLPVIMATARGSSDDIVQALEYGANDYVTKPIDFPVVLARLSTHLQVKSASQRIRTLALDLERGKNFVRSVFGRYLSDDIVDNLLNAPQGLDLGGSRRKVSVLMSDLRGFSSMSENLPPEEVVRLLNHYLGSMTDIIQRHGGTIDEFIGDAILVIFGAPRDMPDHAERAVRCALDMQLAMGAVNRRQQELGLPPLEMGIGINSGPAVVGNIGSEKRAKYGVVGRTVNLASRIESFTVGGQVLIADSTRDLIETPLNLAGSTEISPKGSSRELTLHNVRGIGGDNALELPLEHSELQPLPEPMACRIGVIEGKRLPSQLAPTELIRLSEKEAQVRLPEGPFGLLSNVLLELTELGPTGKVYGKITGTDQAARLAQLRFSSISEAVQTLARSLGAK